MKLNTLQLKRALSAALFVLLLVVAGTKNALAQNQMATLQHNDTITGVYYGSNAFVEAHTAAVDGDIITLSSGTFAAPYEINKVITIHGAGCVYDTLTQVTPTIITGQLYIHQNNISVEGLWLPGIVSITYGNYTCNNITFTKCNINRIQSNSPSVQMFCQFNNCIINDYSLNRHHGTSIINSVVKFTAYNQTDNYNPTNIYNSVVVFNNGLPINNLIAYNSIIATTSGHDVSNCTFFNCIGIETGETLLFEEQTAQNVMEVDGYEDVFETFVGIMTYDNIYQLKEEIATGFWGHDGTEVGIYGGMMPYNPRPSYMRMKRCNVASRSTVDGKLSVEIEVLTDDE